MTTLVLVALIISVVNSLIIIARTSDYLAKRKALKTITVEYEEGAVELKKAHNGDASYDVCVKEDVPIHQGRQVLPTGIKTRLPNGYHAFLMPTSGNSSKGMNGRKRLADGSVEKRRISGDMRIGTIDNNYRGMYGVTFDCYENTEGLFIEKGTKVAQLWVTKGEEFEIVSGDVNDVTERMDGSFGTTDK